MIKYRVISFECERDFSLKDHLSSLTIGKEIMSENNLTANYAIYLIVHHGLKSYCTFLYLLKSVKIIIAALLKTTSQSKPFSRAKK